MPAESMASLLEIVPAPVDVRSSRVGSDTAPGLPTDYMDLVRTYGAGVFNGFLWLLVPHGPTEALDLDQQRVEQRAVLAASRQDGERVPDELVGHEDRLTPWAVSDNGDVVWWFASEREVDEGRVYVCATRPLEWAIFDDTCSGFLRRFVLGGLPEDVLLDDLGEPRFEAWQGSRGTTDA